MVRLNFYRARARLRPSKVLLGFLFGALLFPVFPRLALAQNQALKLGSGNAYVSFGDPTALHLAQFTIETWFRRDGTGVTGGTGTGGIPSFLPLVTKGAAEGEGS